MKVEGFELIDETTADAGVIRHAIEDSVPVIEDLWGWRRPRRAKVVVWTDWMEGYRLGLPWYQRLLLPLLRKRIAAYGTRLWKVVGGITLRTRPPAAVVKPPRLLNEADVRLGEKLFVRLGEITERVRAVTCHELVHAYANSQGLEPWINEGVAMLTVDRFFGFDTVKPQTIELLGAVDRPVRSYLAMHKLTDSELVKLYARGYWITRYLHETRPATLHALLHRGYGGRGRDRKLAKDLGIDRHLLWEQIDGVVFDHFHG